MTVERAYGHCKQAELWSSNPSKRSWVRPDQLLRSPTGIEFPKVVELMSEIKTKRRPAAKKVVAGSTRRASHRQQRGREAVDRTTEFSEDVLKSLDDGARTAIDAVRKFVETVDKELPPRGEGPSRREEITDSALEMAQRLVHTQYEFLCKVVDSAGKTLSRSDDAR
jgi:hypothetical protein